MLRICLLMLVLFGCSTKLDDGDDTGESATGFAGGATATTGGGTTGATTTGGTTSGGTTDGGTTDGGTTDGGTTDGGTTESDTTDGDGSGGGSVDDATTGGETTGDDDGTDGSGTAAADDDGGSGDALGGCIFSGVCYPGFAYGECTEFGGTWLPDGCPGDDDGGGDDGDAAAPFEPIAIGFEFHGIWEESTGRLLDYVWPGILTASGDPEIYRSHVIVRVATAAYFAALTEEEKAGEYCEWVALFGGSYEDGDLTEPVAYDMESEEFDWTAGVGGTGVEVAEWTAWEGGLMTVSDSWGSRCSDWEDGEPLDLFNGMHFGLGLAPLSSYMSTELLGTDWWDETTDPYSYFTMYTAMNHPNEDVSEGWDFIGYDFSGGLYVEVDKDVCVDSSVGGGTVCGEVQFDPADEDFVYNYRKADFREDEGERFAFIMGNAWWYEDFPNLDLDLMKEGFYVEEVE